MDDEKVLCRFGTPLEPLEEDEIPSKKPIQLEDQIVTDENGRRRFHGAFTGGFSAGFWNTVGSLEGWQPKEFKSSRAEKAELHQQKPSDFMDDEDLGEFGIAPQRVQTTQDFTPQDNKIGQKRKIQQNIDGPIPGVPVLQQLLRPAKEMVAIRLLKKMGWKQGQGVGARQTRKEKKTTSKRNAREQYIMKMYGCDISPNKLQSNELNSDSDDLSDSEEITFAPDDFEPYFCVIKDNTFGLGYTGLCRDPILKNQHVNLFGPLEIVDKDNKKLSIRGQAFGVGALEEEDEDIYQRDDMTKYDFTLYNIAKQKYPKKQIKTQESFVIDGFHLLNQNNKNNKKMFKISLPDNFTPRNWLKRRTRFEPLDDNRIEIFKKNDEYKQKGLGRHDLNPKERGQILGENLSTIESIEKCVINEDNEDKYVENFKRKKTYLEQINEKYKDKEVKSKRNDILNMLSTKFDKFTKSEIIKEDGTIETHSDLCKEDIVVDDDVRKENDKVQNEANKITNKLDKTVGIFKPFLSNDLKQERYDKFLGANLKTDDEIKKFLLKIQPLHMSEWDREIEKKEFVQAQKIYKPLKGMMKDRFVPESTIIAEREIKQVAKESNEKLSTLRIRKMWKPCSELCKRFNIAEPFGGTMIEEKIIKKTKFSVFDYLETSINDKNNFITPVIIPKKIEIVKPLIQQKCFSRIKDKFKSNEKFKDDYLSKDNIKNIETTKSLDLCDKSIKEINLKKSLIENLKIIEKPKTELEKKIEETKDQHPAEKKDLFKSIFDSSSEDEDNQEIKNKTEYNNKNEMNKSIEISKDILSILTKPTNVIRNNLLPESSIQFNLKDFPKPNENINILAATVKETTNSFNNEIQQSTPKIIFKSKKQRLAADEEKNVQQQFIENVYAKEIVESNIVIDLQKKIETTQTIIDDDNNIYGPKIPVNSLKTTVEENKDNKIEDIDGKLLNILTKNKKKTKIVEEWVEKTDIKLSSDKSRKKKKKDKDKEKNKKSKKHKKDKKHKK